MSCCINVPLICLHKEMTFLWDGLRCRQRRRVDVMLDWVLEWGATWMGWPQGSRLATQ